MATTYKSHTGNGSKLEFDYPFPALKTEDVQVALNGGVQATTKYTVSLAPAHITFNNSNLDNTLQESTGAPKNGVEVRVFRNTDVDNPKGIFAAGSSIRSVDLNANVDQALYALQEEKNQPLWNVAFEGGTIDGVTIGGTTPAAGTFSNLTISNLDSTIIGANTAAAGTFTTATANIANITTLNANSVDINGGHMDGVAIGDTTKSSGKFTSADIDGGHIDATIIGSSSAEAGTFTNLTATGNLSVDSNTSKLKLGDSQELEVYHNGTNSYIDNNKGNLYIRNNVDDDEGHDIFIQPKSGENGISIYDDEGVILYYDGEERLRVYNTNIQIDKPLVSDASGSDADRTLGTSSNKWKNIYTEQFTASGHVALGDGASDQISFGGLVDSDIIPYFDGEKNLGSATKEWKNLYIDGVAYIDEISLDNDQKIKLGSSGDTEIYDTGTAFNIDADGTIVLDTHTGAFSVAAQGTTKLGWASTVGGFVNDDWLPFANDTHSLGADSLKWKNLKLTGTAYLPTVDIDAGNIDGTTIGATTAAAGSFTRLTLNQNPSRICSDTSDTSDDKSIIISGGGDVTTARGSTIASYGNEHTQAGNLDLYSGATSTGKITLSAGPSTTLGLTVTKDGDVEIPNDLSVTGTLTVNGTTTTLNTSTLEVEDKNITLAKVSTPTDVTADGGGITIKGATDKTFNWVNATDAFTSSEHIHLAADDKKLILGAASTDAEIYYNGNTLVLDTEGQVLVESVGSQNYKIGSVIRLALYEPTSQILANWPIVPGADDTYDLGSSSHKWKDIYIDGTAYLDKVGIGTSSPTNALDVQGGSSNTAIVARSTDAKAQISLVDNTTTGVGSVVIGAEGDALFLTSGSGGTTALTLDSSQNATFAGDIKLSGSTINNITNATADGSDNQVLIVGGGGAGFATRGASAMFYGNEVSSNPGNLYLYGGGVSTSKIQLHTGSSGTLGLVVDENQNVGIGATSPNKPLHIYTGSSDSEIQLQTNSGTEQNSYITLRQASGDLELYTVSAGTNMKFNTANTLALTLDGSQNATFAGSIFSSAQITGNSSNSTKYVRMYGGAGTGKWDIYGHGANLRFSDNESAGTIIFDHNVGIGGTAPGSLLSLTAAAGTKAGISLGTVGDNITASRYIGICKTADHTDLAVNSGFSGIEFGGPSSTDEGYLAFHTHDMGVASAERLRIDKSGNIKTPDNGKLVFGDGDDLSIWHGESNSGNGENANYISSASGRNIVLQVQDDANGIAFHKRTGTGLLNFEPLAVFTAGGANSLYFDGSKKLETLSDGLRVSGYIYANDSNRLCLGDSADLQIYHDGSNSNIKNGTGWLNVYAGGNGFSVGNGDFSENLFKAANNGAVELYYDNSKKFHTFTGGVKFFGTLEADDSDKIKLGDNGELEIYHGSDNSSYIKEGGSGNLYIYSENLRLENADGSKSYIEANNGGSVELYDDGVKAFDTTTNGVVVYGGTDAGAMLYLYADQGADNADKWRFSTGDDGDIYLQNYADGAWETSMSWKHGSGTEFWYDGYKKCYTDPDGIKFDDGYMALFGSNDELKILHDGSNTYFKAHVEGATYHRARTNWSVAVNATDGGADDAISAVQNGAVKLYYDGGTDPKFETTSTGVTVTGAVTETSDIALKTNIKPIDNVLDKIKQITGYTYQFKDTGHGSIGVTAQDVEKVFPELVHGEEGAKTLQYSGLIGALIESVKELSAKVKALEAG